MLSYLYSAGLGAMLFFVLASLVLNIVSIATTAWTEPNDIGLWLPCFLNGEYRPKCFKTTSQALIATGTAFNCLAFILSVASQASHVLEKFKNTIGQFLVLGAMVTSILCLIFNSIGWYLVFFPTYQNLYAPASLPQLSLQTMIGYRLGWSFWLMTPSFFCSTFAAIVAAAVLGCGCTSKVLERHHRTTYQQDYNNQPGGDERKDRYDGKATDTAGKDNLFVSRF